MILIFAGSLGLSCAHVSCRACWWPPFQSPALANRLRVVWHWASIGFPYVISAIKTETISQAETYHLARAREDVALIR